jgi:hypothetical protein
MAGERKTPVLLAKDLGVRPQLIYGLIRQKRIHAYGEKPQMVDVAEVKAVLKGVKHREPKEVRLGRQPSRGTVLGHRTKNGVRHDVVVGAILPSEGDSSDYMGLLHTKGANGRRDQFIYDAQTIAKMVKDKTFHIESPNGLLGMVVYHLRENGQTEKAEALYKFSEEVLELHPQTYQAEDDDPKALLNDALLPE